MNWGSDMYYEEKVIKGVLHFRTRPKGSWRILKKDLPALIGNLVLSMEKDYE